MRTSIYAALLVGMLPLAAFSSSAFAADLGPYEEPEPGPPPVALPPPVAVLPPPQVPLVVVAPPPCGVYRPCVRPYARFGYYGPRPYRFRPRPAYVYEKPAYAPTGREGYGYDYDRDRFERAHEHFSHYGYGNERPRPEPYERRYERRERAERYEGGRPYADPLGHDDVDGRRGERLGGYDRREEERFERGPSPDDRGPSPYDRG